MTTRAFVLLAVCTFLLFGSLACSRTRPMQDDKNRPIDAALVAYLSEARALHHKANMAEDGRDVAGAIAALESLVNAPHPTSPEVDEVLADTDARLAELELERGGAEATTRATTDVTRGLGRGASPYFRGHLLEVLGTIDETRARELQDAGDPDGAARERKKAADALDEAVRIQDDVVRRALGDAGGR